jgi:hypothetical protein
VNHRITIHEEGEGGVQAVCSCGWRSPVYGTDKTAGTMDPLQRAAEAGDLHLSHIGQSGNDVTRFGAGRVAGPARSPSRVRRWFSRR